MCELCHNQQLLGLLCHSWGNPSLNLVSWGSLEEETKLRPE